MELNNKQTRRVIAAAYSDRLETLGEQASDSQFIPRASTRRVKQTDEIPVLRRENFDRLLLDYLNDGSFDSPTKYTVRQNSVLPSDASSKTSPRKRLDGQGRGSSKPPQGRHRGNLTHTHRAPRKPLPSWL